MQQGGLLLLIGFLISPSLGAEPFNNRGVLWEKVAPAGTHKPRVPVKPDLSGFNRRGVDWVVVAPVGSQRLRPQVRARPEAYQRR